MIEQRDIETDLATVHAIASTVGVPLQELRYGGRQRHLVDARRATATALRARNWSYERIGRALRHHHTSVINWLSGRPVRFACLSCPLTCGCDGHNHNGKETSHAL
jgi:hypothetical protein